MQFLTKQNYKKIRLIRSLIFILLTVSVFDCLSSESNAAVITVDVSALTAEGGVRLLQTSVKPTPTNLTTLVERPLVDGKFRWETEVKAINRVYLGVRSQDGKNRIAKLQFILEPGKTDIKFDSDRSYTLKSGKFNDLLVNSWSQNPEYKVMKNDLKTLSASVDGWDFSEEERREYFKLNKRLIEIKTNAISPLLDHHDPLVQLLAIQMGATRGLESSLERLAKLRESLGDHPGLLAAIRVFEGVHRDVKVNEDMKVGVVLPDFEAPDLDGNMVGLQSVRSNSNYVLIEFWASWCAPCRAEIPYMKTAYKAYHDKGFEVVSFSIDDDREAWMEASEEEDLPWFNTCDLEGCVSPIAEQYGAASVPKNYLVDSKTGLIVGVDLRNKKLGEKLQELFAD